jgi:four helix bundle protein
MGMWECSLQKKKHMFLQLAHTKLAIFEQTKKLVLEIYRLTKKFPQEERFSLILQIRRAALSVHLNVAEGCSRKSGFERKRYFEIARGSIIEIDTAIDIAMELQYCLLEDLAPLNILIVNSFKQLSGLIKSVTPPTHN